MVEPLVAPTLNTWPLPAAMSPSRISEATPDPAFVTVKVESDALLTSSVKAVALFCKTVELPPITRVPEPESNVRSLAPSELILTAPALAAV